MTKITILYHANCYDGFGGAFSVWEKYGDNASYYGCTYGSKLLPLKNKDIYFIDFTYPRNAILELQKYNTVTILDHHISAQNDLKDMDNAYFDMDKSGAVIAWEYFHPKEPVPWILEYIQDKDLYKFALPHSREINSLIYIMPFDFEKWHNMSEMDLENHNSEFIKCGELLMISNNREIELLLQNRQSRIVDGWTAGVVNYGGKLVSEIANRLCGESQLGICWSVSGGRVNYSFRTLENSGLDVSKIAKKFGGGGHKLAAGTTVPLNAIPNELKFWE